MQVVEHHNQGLPGGGLEQPSADGVGVRGRVERELAKEGERPFPPSTGGRPDHPARLGRDAVQQSRLADAGLPADQERRRAKAGGPTRDPAVEPRQLGVATD